MSLKGLTAGSSKDSSSLLVSTRLRKGYDSCHNNAANLCGQSAKAYLGLYISPVMVTASYDSEII